MRPRRVLAVMDASARQPALLAAQALANRCDAELMVVAAVDTPPDLNVLARVSGSSADDLLSEFGRRRRDELQALALEIVPERDIQVEILTGKAFIEIIRFVTAHGCDFVVKAAEPSVGRHRYLFASTDQHLLRKCPCPVWLQTTGGVSEPKRVLATIDLDTSDAPEPETLMALNQRVLDAAQLIAAPTDSEIVLLHVWDAIGEGMVWAFSGQSDARASADRYVEAIRSDRQAAMHRFVAQQDSGGDRPVLTPRLVRGTPEEAIEAQVSAQRADVVVMGTVARTGLRGVFIGNTAENVLNSLACPVVAVKPDGFVSPLAT